MERLGFLKSKPLTVVRASNGKFQIKDGGHRLAAARILKIPVRYCVEEPSIAINIADLNNTQRSWSIRDYVSSHIRQGNKQYLELDEFSKKHKLSLYTSAQLLLGNQGGCAAGGNIANSIKKGAFVVKNAQYADAVGSILSSIRQYTNLASNMIFIRAISRCCLVSEFNKVRFCEKVAKFPELLTPRPDLDGYLELCQHVYNYHSAGKDTLALQFKATAANAKRSFGAAKK